MPCEPPAIILAVQLNNNYMRPRAIPTGTDLFARQNKTVQKSRPCFDDFL